MVDLANKEPQLNKLAWTRRWPNESSIPSGPSPFGVTENGRQDYRGVSVRSQKLRNEKIIDADFSYADLHHLQIVDCTFENCCFDMAILTQLYAIKSRFEGCSFVKADLRIAQLGMQRTDFRRCEFDGVKVKKAGFYNVVFEEVKFRAQDWSHVDFGASGFWNCWFEGSLVGISLRGRYLYPSQREMHGEPVKTGLHNVSFAKANLHWIGVHDGCVLENIILPENGSAFICLSKDLIGFALAAQLPRDEAMAMREYLRIIRPDSDAQEKKIISKCDLQEIANENVGRDLYDRLRLGLST